MKRIIAWMLVLVLMLAGCSGESAETTEPTGTTAAPTETTAPATEPPAQTTEATEAPTEETAPAFTNPLTGEALDAAYEGRPIAIMLNNHKIATPHQGVAAADILYETCVEGDMTRFMAIFTDIAAAGPIGSIRSCRPPYVDIVQGYDAVYSSASGDQAVLDRIYNNGVDYINGLISAKFYRDDDRMNNMGFEHSLMVDGEDLLAEAQANGWTQWDAGTYGLNFDEAPIGGESAASATVTFTGGKTSSVAYDASLGGYKLSQYGAEYVDGNTGEALVFRNVLVLQAHRWIMSNGIHVQMDTVGSGSGWYLRDGKIIPITWSRADVDEPFTYTDASGNTVSFGAGKTYVAIIPEDLTVSYN